MKNLQPQSNLQSPTSPPQAGNLQLPKGNLQFPTGNLQPLSALPYSTAYNTVLDVFGKICLTIGARLPEPELCPLLYNWVLNFFGGYSVQELVLAFDMNAAGTQWEQVPHYNSFDKMFIGAVLGHYKKYKEEMTGTVRPTRPPVKEPTEQERRQGIIDSLHKIVEDYRRFQQNPDCLIMAVKFKVKLLEQSGVLRISNEEKWEWYRKAVKQHALNLKAALADRTILFTSTLLDIIKRCEAGDAPTAEDNKIKGVAREMALRHYFRKWSEEGFDLENALLSRKY